MDEDGYLRGSPARQAAELEAAVSEDERIADELAEAEDSAEVAAAIEEAGEGYRADLEGAKLQAKIKAERAETAADSLRQEQDERVESGEFDQWNAEALRRSEKPAGRASANSKLKAKRNSYVRRAGKFVPAANAELVEGEELYWYRKRKFGQTAKFILFGRWKEERKANVQTSSEI